MLAPASATGNLGVFVVVIIFGFAVGIAGHVTESRTLVITGIILIAAVSIYFAAVGQVQTFAR